MKFGCGGESALPKQQQKRCRKLLSGNALEVAEAGLERTANSSGNTGHSEKGGAESGASSGDSASIDPDLMAVVNAWPTLPETTRRQIAATIREAVGSHGVGDGGAR